MYKIEFITSENHSRRSVAFLVSSNERGSIKEAFDRLGRNSELMLRSRFDAWVDGIVNKKWYHGWDQSEFQGRYTSCFVFKCKEKRLQHRFYGFLCNPKIRNRGYQVCILVIHAKKNEWETYEADLRTVEEVRKMPIIQKAISDYFGEKP